MNNSNDFLQDYPCLEYRILNISETLNRLPQFLQRSLCFRFSFWNIQSIRISENAEYSLPLAEGNPSCRVDLTRLIEENHSGNSMGNSAGIGGKEAFLYIDLIDEKSGIPLCWGAGRIVFQDSLQGHSHSNTANSHHKIYGSSGSSGHQPTESISCFTTGDKERFTVLLRFNDLIDGFKYSGSCSLTIESCLVFGSHDEQQVVSTTTMKYLRPHPQSGITWIQEQHKKKNAMYITIQDALLSPDITEVYAGRTILICSRAGKSGRRCFLGSIQEGKGNWLESNELQAQLTLDELLIEVFLAHFSTTDGWRETPVCQGSLLPEHKLSVQKKSKRNNWTSGAFECRLTTSIRSRQSPSLMGAAAHQGERKKDNVQEQTVKVGKVRLSLFMDNGQLVIPYKVNPDQISDEWLSEQIAQLVSSDEVLSSKLLCVVYLLGLLDIENPVRNAINLEYTNHLLGLLTRWGIWQNSVLSTLTVVIVQLQLPQRLLFLLNMLFEEWLTSDGLQELITFSRKPPDGRVITTEHTVDSLQDQIEGLERALLTLSISYILHKNWGDSLEFLENILDLDSIQELSGDLLTVIYTCKYQLLQRLMKLFEESAIIPLGKAVYLLNKLLQLEVKLQDMYPEALSYSIQMHALIACRLEVQYLFYVREKDPIKILLQEHDFYSLVHYVSKQIHHFSHQVKYLCSKEPPGLSILRIANPFLGILDGYNRFIRLGFPLVKSFMEYFVIEEAMMGSFDILNGLLDRILCLSNTEELKRDEAMDGMEDEIDETTLQEYSTSFQSLTSLLEGMHYQDYSHGQPSGNSVSDKMTGNREGGSTRRPSQSQKVSEAVRASRRVSYVSITRSNSHPESLTQSSSAFSLPTNAVTVKRVAFDEPTGSSDDQVVKDLSGETKDLGKGGSSLFDSPNRHFRKPSPLIIPSHSDSPVTARVKVLSASTSSSGSASPMNATAATTNDGDHSFYQQLELMNSFQGSAMLLLLEICQPLFSVLITTVQTLRELLRIEAKSRSLQIYALFHKLQGSLLKILGRIIGENTVQAGTLQSVLLRYCSAVGHLGSHLRSGLQTFLLFAVIFSRLYRETCLQSSNEIMNRKLWDYYLQTALIFSVMKRLYGDNYMLADTFCRVVDVYSPPSTSFLHEEFYLYSPKDSPSERAAKLREESVETIRVLLLSLNQLLVKGRKRNVKKQMNDFDENAIMLLFHGTILSAMQVFCSILHSIIDMKVLYSISRNPDAIIGLQSLFHADHLKQLLTILLDTACVLQGYLPSKDFSEPTLILEGIFTDIRYYLLQLVLEISMVMKPIALPKSSSYLPMHRQFLQQTKLQMNDHLRNSIARLLMECSEIYDTKIMGKKSNTINSTDVIGILFQCGWNKSDFEGDKISCSDNSSQYQSTIRNGDDERRVECSDGRSKGQCVRDLMQVLSLSLIADDDVDDCLVLYTESTIIARQSYHSLHLYKSPHNSLGLPFGILFQTNLIGHRSLFWLQGLIQKQSESQDDEEKRNELITILRSSLKHLHSDLRQITPFVNHSPYWCRFMGFSAHAFVSFILFYLHRYEAQWEDRGDMKNNSLNELSNKGKDGSITPPKGSFLHRERELQYLRDCLTAFVATGYWEIGLRIASLYRAFQTADKTLASKVAADQGHFSNSPRLLTSTSRKNFTSQVFSFDIISPHSPTIRMNKSMLFGNSSPMPSTPYSNNSNNPNINNTIGEVMSPQRTATITSELGRVLSKLEEKLKHEGSLRMPSVFYALRFVSFAPLDISASMLDSLNEDLPSSQIERCNLTNVYIHQQGVENVDWYEEWFLLRYDLSSFASAAQFYRDYLRSNQTVPTSQQRESANSLHHPLSFHQTAQQLANHFPGFVLLPNHFTLETLMTSLVQSNQRNTRFLQCFAAYPAKVCQEAHDLTLYSEPLLQYKQRKVRRRLGRHDDSGNDLSEEGGNDHEEEEEDSSDDDSDGDIIQSSDLNELLEMGDYQREPRFDVENDAGKWRIKRNALEKQYLSFDGFPKDFFVYSVMSTEENGVMVRRYSLATSQKHISVEDITKLKQKWQGKTVNTSTGLARDEQVDGGKNGNSNGKGKFKQLTDGEDYHITAASLSPLISVAHVHTEDILTLTASTEVMLYNNVKLARIYRCMKHCNSLTITELANQPETALLHSDHLFQTAFCMLSNLLATPSISPIGLANVDTILLKERESIESKWQNMRKHAKREYMREISVFQQSTRDLLQHRTMEVPKKPQEPDLDALKAAYDQQAGLEKVSLLQQHRDLAYDYVKKITKEMRKFAEALLAAQQSEGETKKFASLNPLSPSSYNLSTQPHNKMNPMEADSSATIKLKQCLYIEALYHAIDLGMVL